jgi:hypothetical protein
MHSELWGRTGMSFNDGRRCSLCLDFLHGMGRRNVHDYSFLYKAADCSLGRKSVALLIRECTSRWG